MAFLFLTHYLWASWEPNALFQGFWGAKRTLFQIESVNVWSFGGFDSFTCAIWLSSRSLGTKSLKTPLRISNRCIPKKRSTKWSSTSAKMSRPARECKTSSWYHSITTWQTLTTVKSLVPRLNSWWTTLSKWPFRVMAGSHIGVGQVMCWES